LLSPAGAAVARLDLDARLRAGESPEPELVVDLTGLRKSEETTPYEVTYVVMAALEATESGLGALIRGTEKPLRHAAR